MAQLLETENRRRPSTRAQAKKRAMEEIMNYVYDSLEEEVDCPVCFESCLDMGMSIPPCGHFLCKTCAKVITTCPLCRRRFRLEDFYPAYL